MSAWIVDQRHIDFMVAAMMRSEAVPQAGIDRNAIGHELWSENFDSVNFRYDEYEPVPAYTFEAIALPDLDTGQGLLFTHRAFACYQYQACEHPAWHDSRAAAWTGTMLDHLARAIEAVGGTYDPMTGWQVPGVEDFGGGWGIDARYDPAVLVGQR